ncbi:MAG TPA: hypothetical protein VKV23_05115 [Acidimicrobiales bacterium]|jgi:hypothetical protein|nr:hypothetical protein [Acidimicrobiales bacterium]
MSEAGDALDLDLAVASLAADGRDTELMVRLLVERLAGALGERLRVERGGGLLRRGDAIRRVAVRVGDDELVAELGGGAPRFTVGRISGGVRIRTERTDAAAWLRRLLDDLAAEAAHSATTRQALEAIVIGAG